MARDMRYGAAAEALPQRIAHAVLVRMEAAGEAPDDRVQDAVARSQPVKAAVKAIWPPVDPAKTVLRLLSDPDFLATCADGILTAEEQELIRWAKPARGLKSAPWSSADTVLVDEAIGPGPTHPLARARRARRGAGPVPHAVPRGRPPLHDRFGDRAGRHRPGHDALGHRHLGRRRWRTSANRTPASRS